MADSQTTVTNLDIQLLDADRSNATTIKLDNPKDSVTREQVSAALQTPLTEGWFLTSKGSTAMYLGDITINQSIKTKLGGEDFYVTPASLSFSMASSSQQEHTETITVVGATIQGYNFINKYPNGYSISAEIAQNALSINVKFTKLTAGANNGKIILIIQGTEVAVPFEITI